MTQENDPKTPLSGWQIRTLADAYADQPEHGENEMEYRLGYHAGFVAALKLADSLRASNAGTAEEIADAMFAYWYRELARWKANGDDYNPPAFERKVGV